MGMVGLEIMKTSMMTSWLHRWAFFREGVWGNRWLWLHMLAGAILARLLEPHLAPWLALGAVFVLALAWEAVEAGIDHPGRLETTLIYGSVRAWVCDSMADVLGATAMAALVLW